MFLLKFFRKRTKKALRVKSSRPAQPRQFDKKRTSKASIQTTTVTIVSETTSVEISELVGYCSVVDGDTIRIGKQMIRLAGVDAPEIEHPWGQKAKWALVGLVKGQKVIAHLEPELSYDRVVATCALENGQDLSAEMVKLGLALDWAKFSGGKYAKFEPAGVRKKLWRVAAKHNGTLHPKHFRRDWSPPK